MDIGMISVDYFVFLKQTISIQQNFLKTRGRAIYTLHYSYFVDSMILKSMTPCYVQIIADTQKLYHARDFSQTRKSQILLNGWVIWEFLMLLMLCAFIDKLRISVSLNTTVQLSDVCVCVLLLRDFYFL